MLELESLNSAYRHHTVSIEVNLTNPLFLSLSLGDLGALKRFLALAPSADELMPIFTLFYAWMVP